MIQLYQTLDLRPIGIPQTLRLSQYDSDFEIIFELTNFDGTWILDTNTTAEVQGTKTDGHGYSADAVFDDQLKTVTIAGDVQMTAAAGRNTFEVVLFHDGDRLGSKNFILDVERAALDAETTASDSKIKNFTEMVESAEAAAETATAAAEAAEEAASTFSTDTTLTISGKAADALTVGDALRAIEPGLSAVAKAALLACFRNVAWINEHGQEYYDALEEALEQSDIDYITADFEQGSAVIYEDTQLEDLRQYLTVSVTYSDGTTATVTDYSLVGTLTEGTSAVAVLYGGKTTAFSVNVASVVSVFPTISDGASIDVGDTIASLREYMTVYAAYDAGTTREITDYTLPGGNIVSGTNTIPVSYKTAVGNVYLYAPTNNNDQLAYKIPDNTELSDSCIDTGVKLHDELKDFTILTKITDKCVVSTSGITQKFFATNYTTTANGPIGSRFTIAAQDDNGTDKKKYTQAMGANVESGLVANSNHEVISVVRLKWNNDYSSAERTISLFVDGTKIQTSKSNVASSYLDRPTSATVCIGQKEMGVETYKAFSGTVKLFEIYKRALTDSEVNTKLGVTI